MGTLEPDEKSKDATRQVGSEKKPESREQRRWRERLNIEVNQVINSLQDQFITFFMNVSDPEGEEVANKMKEISAKWLMFCKKKHLIPKAKTIMDDFMTNCVNDYLTEKALQEAEAQKLTIETTYKDSIEKEFIEVKKTDEEAS